LGFSSEISRSTLADANEKRDWKIYRDLANILISRARDLYCDDKEFDLDLSGACYVIDASVIELCLNIFPWAKLKTVRAAIKLNMQLDLKGNLPTFFTLTSGKEADVKFLDDIDFESGACYIMDRGYIDYGRLYTICQQGAFFVTRAKDNFAFKRLYSNPIDKKSGLRCDQVVRLTGYYATKDYPAKLRRVKYFDKSTGHVYVFLTNDFNISALTVATLYKHRWQVELFFKWIKQHLKIKSFWGRSANAVKTQICIAICAYLIVAIAKKELKIERNLYEILQILNVSLFVKMPINTLLSELEQDTKNDQEQKQACLFNF
jgi:transposase